LSAKVLPPDEHELAAAINTDEDLVFVLFHGALLEANRQLA
jgi:hypothetical protein